MKRKKTQVANLIMAALIFLILAAGIVSVAYLKGWFGDEESKQAKLSHIKGLVYVTRADITYLVQDELLLRDKDQILCKKGASARIDLGDANPLSIREESEVKITSAQKKNLIFEVLSGRVYAGDEAENPLDRNQLTMIPELAQLGLEYECTLTIKCSTILSHLDRLKTGKSEWVPENGLILAAVRVPFSEGETAFDITKRACDAYQLPFEYNYTPLNQSYYVEGIQNIYEFDCGPESGWMFKVNGWFPNHGASSYLVVDGDDVMWEYTCVGLGADLKGGGK